MLSSRSECRRPVVDRIRAFPLDDVKVVGSWHPPPEPPPGIPNGAEGVSVSAGSDIVLISSGGRIWNLPAARPEPGKSSEQTLRREMDEEPCATVVAATLTRAERQLSTIRVSRHVCYHE